MAVVYHVTTVHPVPDPRIFLKECTTLSQTGHKVVVLACIDQREIEFNGYRIVSVGKPSRSHWRRLAYQPAILRKLVQAQPDIVHFHDPELLPMMCCLAGRGGRKQRIIFDIHENYESTIGSKVFKGIYARLRLMAENNMTFVLAEDSYHEFCLRAHPVIHNYALDVQTAPWSKRARRVVYLGSVSEHRGALCMIRGFAAAQLRDWELLIIGRKRPELLKRMNEESDRLGLSGSVKILGYLPAKQAMELVRHSRIGLALLHPVPNYVRSLPTKAFEYLSAGVPVLLSNFPFYRQFFEDTPAITFVNPRDAVKIGQALYQLANTPNLEDIARKGRQYYLDHFNWTSEGNKLLEIYARLMDNPAGTHL